MQKLNQGKKTAIKTTDDPIKNIVAQHQVERWEEKEGIETTLIKKNSIQNSMGNEENGYPVPDPKKTMIKVTKEHSNTHIKNSQRRNLGRYHRKIHREDTRYG
jgi:hypothetical protein